MKDSSPISSQALISRMTALITGEVKPETGTDRILLEEMEAIRAAGGFISVPTDLPDPMTPDDLARHLDVSDDESETKSIVKNSPRFDWYGRDGDYDGNVQDGTPFERRSRSNSHNAIGRRRKLVQRLRLRDLPFPFAPPPVSPDKPPVAATSDSKSLLGVVRRAVSRTNLRSRRQSLRPANFKPNAIDGNRDGMVQDGTRFERPAPPRVPSGDGPQTPKGPEVVRAPLPSPGKLPPRPHRARMPEMNRWASDYAEIIPAGYVEERYNAARERNRAAIREGAREEREARLRNEALAAPLPARSGKRVSGNPAKRNQEETKAFASASRRDDVGSLTGVTSQDISELRSALRSGDVLKVSKLVKRISPFGGYRSKSDGAHPAVLATMRRHDELVEKKYGKLETDAEMEAALRKAFPNAKIGLREYAIGTSQDWLETTPWGPMPVAAEESFRVSQVNLRAKLKKLLQSDRAARDAEQAILRRTTVTLLALAERDPEVAKKLRYVGFTELPEDSGVAAFVGGMPMDAPGFGLFVNPLAVASSGANDPTRFDLLNQDFHYAEWVTTSKDFVMGRDALTSVLPQMISDSDMDATTFSFIAHEWGHATGMTKTVSAMEELQSVAPLLDLFFGQRNRSLDLVKSTSLSRLAKILGVQGRHMVESMASDIATASEELAKRLPDLVARMKELGLPVPANVNQMSDQAREALAMRIIHREVLSLLVNGSINALPTPSERTSRNWRHRLLGQYANVNTEESVAEMFVANLLGLDVSQIVDRTIDPVFHERLGL